MNLGLELASRSVPLIQQFVDASIENNAEQKRIRIVNDKIKKMQIAISSKKPGISTPKLTKGIFGNETVEQLGQRKWIEYENFLEALPNDASPIQVKSALKQIESDAIKDYPCEECRINSVKNLKKSPLIAPGVQSKKDGQKRLCEFHNTVREFLGKPITHNCNVIIN